MKDKHAEKETKTNGKRTAWPIYDAILDNLENNLSDSNFYIFLILDSTRCEHDNVMSSDGSPADLSEMVGLRITTSKNLPTDQLNFKVSDDYYYDFLHETRI